MKILHQDILCFTICVPWQTPSPSKYPGSLIKRSGLVPKEIIKAWWVFPSLSLIVYIVAYGYRCIWSSFMLTYIPPCPYHFPNAYHSTDSRWLAYHTNIQARSSLRVAPNGAFHPFPFLLDCWPPPSAPFSSREATTIPLTYMLSPISLKSSHQLLYMSCRACIVSRLDEPSTCTTPHVPVMPLQIAYHGQPPAVQQLNQT